MLKNSLLIANDILIAGFALLFAYYLRYNLNLPPDIDVVGFYTGFFCSIAAVFFFIFGVHRGVWRFASVSNLRNIVIATSVSMLVFLLAMFLVNRLKSIPRSVPLIAWFVMIVLLSAPRLLYRVWMGRQGGTAKGTRLLIFGSASEAEQVIRRFGLESNAVHEVIGIVDFQNNLAGRKVRGMNVLGDVDRLDEIMERLDHQGRTPDAFVVVRPREHRTALRQITEAGVAHKIPVRRVVEPSCATGS